MSKLTKQRVDAALRKPPASGEAYVWDREIPGFGLRVRPSGASAYVLLYRHAGRARRMTLGSGRVLTPDEARKLARQALATVAAGRDPAAERKQTREKRPAITFSDLADRWLAEHASARLKPRSLARAQGLLTHHVLPSLGRVRVEDLAREHVARLAHSLRKNPTSANRARALVSALCNFAERVGLRPQGSNPTKHVKPFPEERRRRFLSGEELARLGDALDRMEREGTGPCDRQAVTAIRLLLLTGARAGEILGLRWEHVDAERGVLRLPDSKTGAKEILLGPEARALLAELREESDPPPQNPQNPQNRRAEGYVIPGRVEGEPLVGLHRIWKRLLRAAAIDEGLRLHDLRRTAASAGASAGLSLEAVGQHLGHKRADTTKGYAFMFEHARRETAERVERQLVEALAARPKVVPLLKR